MSVLGQKMRSETGPQVFNTSDEFCDSTKSTEQEDMIRRGLLTPGVKGRGEYVRAMPKSALYLRSVTLQICGWTS